MRMLDAPQQRQPKGTVEGPLEDAGLIEGSRQGDLCASGGGDAIGKAIARQLQAP
jgi:hypothetical protein